MTADIEPARRMLSIEQVLKIVPLSRTTLWRMERRGKFPASVELTAQRRGWYEDEVVAWQNTLPKNSRISRRVKQLETRNG